MPENPQHLSIPGNTAPSRNIAFAATSQVPSAEPCVVWLSGFLSDMTGSKACAVAEWAAETGRRAVRFDYSGHGESGGVFTDGTIGLWLEESLAVLREVVRGPSILVGSSMGGWIALLVLRALREGRAPGVEPVRGAVLLAPAWDMTEELMWNTFPDDVRSEITQQGVYHRPSAYDDGAYPITRQLIEEGRAHLIKAAPFDPGCPVRILQGCQDPDVPWQHTLALLDLLSAEDVELTLIKDGEHRLSRPEDIGRLLRTVAALYGDKTSQATG